jgi:hypothetical protein
MELKQRFIIEFLNIRDLTLDDTVMELSSVRGQNAYSDMGREQSLHQRQLGRMDLHFSVSILVRCQFVEYQAFHLVPLFIPFLFSIGIVPRLPRFCEGIATKQFNCVRFLEQRKLN